MLQETRNIVADCCVGLLTFQSEITVVQSTANPALACYNKTLTK